MKTILITLLFSSFAYADSTTIPIVTGAAMIQRECTYPPCLLNDGGTFEIVTSDQFGALLVDCSCLKSPIKGKWELGAYRHTCNTTTYPGALNCKDFAFSIKKVRK